MIPAPPHEIEMLWRRRALVVRYICEQTTRQYDGRLSYGLNALGCESRYYESRSDDKIIYEHYAKLSGLVDMLRQFSIEKVFIFLFDRTSKSVILLDYVRKD